MSMASLRNILLFGACYSSDAFSNRPGPDNRWPPPNAATGPPPEPQFQDPPPPNVDLSGRIDGGGGRAIGDFDRRREASMRRSTGKWWDDASPRVQGGSRRTFQAPFQRERSDVFLQTEGRPLNAEFELWDGPNNTPTRMKVYSEDGRLRPFHAAVPNAQNQRDNTLSVRNSASLEFPLSAGIADISRDEFGGPRGGFGSSGGGGFRDIQPIPSTARGQTVQGGALRTFPLDHSVNAVQVTLVTDGLPMCATVELWGSVSHVKQIAEIYNDNGATRPFAAIVDTPGGSNTIAITNTGPLEYPIRAVVEPVDRMEGWDGYDDVPFGGVTAPW